jgi:NADP-dependent 3-hydroxy acid dehydrogenase YdfG
MPIKKPGERENADGSVVIQSATRAEQLESIADEMEKYLSVHKNDLAADDAAHATVHKLIGYTEQLRIIADEVRESKAYTADLWERLKE